MSEIRHKTRRSWRGHREVTGLLIATIGVPGAGKTTWRTDVAEGLGAVVVSLDECRGRVSCCEANQTATSAAVDYATGTARALLGVGKTVLWDATNARRGARAALLSLAADTGSLAVAVLFETPLPVALDRNASRDPRPCRRCGWARRVPDQVVTALHHDLARDRSRLDREGWHHLHHHTDVRKDTVR